MVIFYSYVSLPEGNWPMTRLLRMDVRAPYSFHRSSRGGFGMDPLGSQGFDPKK